MQCRICRLFIYLRVKYAYFAVWHVSDRLQPSLVLRSYCAGGIYSARRGPNRLSGRIGRALPACQCFGEELDESDKTPDEKPRKRQAHPFVEYCYDCPTARGVIKNIVVATTLSELQ